MSVLSHPQYDFHFLSQTHAVESDPESQVIGHDNLRHVKGDNRNSAISGCDFFKMSFASSAVADPWRCGPWTMAIANEMKWGLKLRITRI